MSNDPAPPSVPSIPSLARHLGLWALVLYGIGDMLGSGIYALIGKAAGLMGNAVWLAFLVSMVAAVLTALPASPASRAAEAMERAMADSGELQRGSNLGKGQVRAADCFLEPNIVSANRNSGGGGAGAVLGSIGGGLFGRGFGAIAGSINVKKGEANVTLSVVNARTTEEEAPRDRRRGFSTLEETMTEHIRTALRRTLGRVEGPQGAARLLGINPHTLRSRMRKLGIDAGPFRQLPED